MPAIRVVTYNIHGCVGLDRRCDPARTAAVLREIDADIVCLQEVDAGGNGLRADQATYLGEATDRRVILGAGTRERRGRFANAVLTRFPSLATRAIDLAVPGYEPRGAIDVDLMIGHRVLRVMATHFGLHAGERRLQANRLIAALDNPAEADRPPAHAVLLVGDLNEWRGAMAAAFARSIAVSDPAPTAYLSFVDAGAAARPDLRPGARGVARCPCLPLAAGASGLRSFAAHRKSMVERGTGAPRPASTGRTGA